MKTLKRIFLIQIIILAMSIGNAYGYVSSKKIYVEGDLGLHIPFHNYGTGPLIALKGDYLLPLKRPFQFLVGLETGFYWPGSVEGETDFPELGGKIAYEYDLFYMPFYINLTYPLFMLDKYTKFKGQIYTFAGFGVCGIE